MSKIDEVYKALEKLQGQKNKGISAIELGNYMNLDRTNISRYLNSLYKEGKVDKEEGRPVLYSISNENNNNVNRNINIENNYINKNSLDKMVGADLSLQVPIQQAKAAILYPPRGLHTLILGETGVGKSMFAELMFEFAKEAGVIKKDAPFIRFNCADYADNQQLVIAQIFGVKKGAYTGADSNRDGLLKKANGGIIFLDEIHRLSPQGQEMLFTYIDKGFFRPLGETDNVVKVDAQIIAATTEDPQSFMLKTFTRRIPMTITLPTLKERTIQERYYLLEQFIKAESSRLGEDIYINKNALISFLLYDCPNNIGQLKSDIQLACAKAFLNYKANKKDYIVVEHSDLHQRVKKGLMKLQEHRSEIESLLESMGEVLKFSYKSSNEEILQGLEENEEISGEYFYDIIEKKLAQLKEKGLEEKKIDEILNVDIEKYFKKYIRDLPGQFRKEEILKIVDENIVDTAEEILSLASKKLKRSYDEKVYFGLAFHLQGSLERIKKGNSIYHPKLDFIRAQYADEFLIAMEAAKIIDKKFNTQIPLDEIGYITMFIASKVYEDNEEKVDKVGVLVIMHGHSTASSMVEVANSLIGNGDVEALDMSLNMKAEKMYEMAKRKVVKMDSGKGVLILVDMGSLTNFGDMIKEETGINIKTVDMTSTLLVVEAGRKANNGRSLEEIYKSCMEISRYGIQGRNIYQGIKEPLIITTCFTGEGSAEKLKQIIYQKLKNSNQVKIKSVNIIDKDDFIEKVDKIKDDYNILAIVGTVPLNIESIPFIPATDILVGPGVQLLDDLICQEEDYSKIAKSIKAQLQDVNGEELVMLVREAINDIEERLSFKIPHEVKVGIAIHLCFLIEKIISGGKGKSFDALNEYRNKHSKEFILVKQSIRNLEMHYNINIGDNELAFIVRMVTENNIAI